jgi:hypothetical protein
MVITRASDVRVAHKALSPTRGSYVVPIDENDPLVCGVDVSGGGAAWNVCVFRRGLDARTTPLKKRFAAPELRVTAQPRCSRIQPSILRPARGSVATFQCGGTRDRGDVGSKIVVERNETPGHNG